MLAYVAAACIWWQKWYFCFRSQVSHTITLSVKSSQLNFVFVSTFCILLLQLYITNTVTSRSMGEVDMIGPHWLMNRREAGNCLFSCGYRRPGCIDGGAQGSSPEFLSGDREINVLQSCLFSKHFVRRTSFKDVFYPF